eukprot:g2864.t1
MDAATKQCSDKAIMLMSNMGGKLAILAVDSSFMFETLREVDAILGLKKDTIADALKRETSGSSDARTTKSKIKIRALSVHVPEKDEEEEDEGTSAERAGKAEAEKAPAATGTQVLMAKEKGTGKENKKAVPKAEPKAKAKVEEMSSKTGGPGEKKKDDEPKGQKAEDAPAQASEDPQASEHVKKPRAYTNMDPLAWTGFKYPGGGMILLTSDIRYMVMTDERAGWDFPGGKADEAEGLNKMMTLENDCDKFAVTIFRETLEETGYTEDQIRIVETGVTLPPKDSPSSSPWYPVFIGILKEDAPKGTTSCNVVLKTIEDVEAAVKSIRESTSSKGESRPHMGSIYRKRLSKAWHLIDRLGGLGYFEKLRKTLGNQADDSQEGKSTSGSDTEADDSNGKTLIENMAAQLMAQVEKCPNDRMRPPSVSEANRAILVAAENEQVYKLVENEEEDEWIGITFEEHCLLFKDKYEDYLDYWEKAVSEGGLKMKELEDGSKEVLPYFEARCFSEARGDPIKVFQTYGGGHYQMLS